MPADLTLLGTPVEVGAITKELKKLWAADQTRTRATLFNFAIVCEGEEAMRENTELLSQFVGSHAFRAILIGVDPSATESKVEAWVNAHCYLPKAGAKHVCSEQVSILIRGNPREILANLLFQQLDYDLPLTLWWRVPSVPLGTPEVWRWVDRLIFDSMAWPNPVEQLQALRAATSSDRTILCDLAWTRSLRLRQALAQMFDTAANVDALLHVRRVSITHAPGARTAAVLLVGWLAAQLNWDQVSEHGQKIRFREGTHEVICDLIEIEGNTISRVELRSESLTVIAARTAGTSFLHLEAREAKGHVTQHLMPGDCEELSAVLDCELASWGRHSVYTKALAVAQALL